MDGIFKAIGVLILVAGLSSMIITVAVADSTVEENRPDHVTCEYNESTLEDYQPKLTINHLDIQPTTVYAEYCSSPEHDTDVAMYWAYYPVQEGISSADSHRLDREPIYVFINEDTGDVDKVVYTGYHYIKATNVNPDIVDTKNTTFEVAKPHHHYTDIGVDAYGEYPSLSDFSTVHDYWYKNGWEANPTVTANPYEIQYTTSWWSNDSYLNITASEWYWEMKFKLQELNPFDEDPTSDLDL